MSSSMDISEENNVTDTVTNTEMNLPNTSEMSPVMKQEKRENEWDVDEEAIFGSPLLEPSPSPKRNDSSLMVGGEATPNDLSENVTPEPPLNIQVDAVLIKNEFSFIRANSVSPVHQKMDTQEQEKKIFEQGANESLEDYVDAQSDAEKPDVEAPHTAFDCQYCGKRWEKLGSLNKHIAFQHKAERTILLKKDDATFVPCETFGCGSSFLTEDARKNHMIVAHGEGVETDADDNTIGEETVFGNESEVSDVEGPTDEFPCHCPFCGRGFAATSSVNKHIAAKHREERAKLNKSMDPNTEASLSCTIVGCNSTFVSEQARQNHLGLAHKEEVTVETDIFACPYCPREYTIYGSLHSHYIRNHRDKPRFSIANSRKGTGEEHEDDFESDREASPEPTDRKSIGEKSQASPRYGCNYCMATFDRLERKVAHERSKHSQDMDASSEESFDSHPCKHDGCERVFNSKKALKSHDVRAHRDSKSARKSIGEKPKASQSSITATPKEDFACEYCENSYDNSGALQVHMQRTHPYEVALRMRNAPEHFACPHCPNKYERLNTLRTHLWRSHPGMPKYTRKELRRSGGGVVDETVTEDKEPEKPKKVEKTPKKDVQKKNEPLTPSVDPLECDTCHKTFASVDFLNKHKLMTHAAAIETTKPFCDVCGQVFKGAQYVLRHKNATSCGQTEKGPEDTPAVESRKRRRETVENDSVQEYDSSDDSSPPKTNQPKIVKQEQFVSPSLGHLQVKTEPIDAHEYRSPLSYIANIIVPQTVKDNDKQMDHMAVDQESPFESRPSSRLIAASPSLASGQTSRRCSINQENIGMSDMMAFAAVGGEVETSPLPLSTAIFTRAAQFANEIMVVWSAALEDDLLAAANMNPAHTIICVQELDVLNLPEQAKNTLKKSHMISLTMLTSNETTSQWTVIAFGEQVPPASLKNRLFKNFQNVENILTQHAAARGMDVINIMRYSKDGLFPSLSKCFAKKTIGFNHQQ